MAKEAKKELENTEGKPLEEPEKEKKEETPKEAEKPAEKVDELEALRQELEKAKAQAAEYLEGWQRTQAEFANYKKRIEQERQELLKLANATLIAKLLPIMDDFERAFQTLPRSLARLTWIDGMALIHRRLQAILEAEGLTAIETEGRSFDPLLHEAVTYEEVEGYDDGQIIEEVQKGYKLHDRILRPALVRVAKKVEAKEEANEEAKEEADRT